MGDFADYIGGLLPAASEDEGQGEMRALARFRRALRLEDQQALDDLLISVKNHWGERSLAPHATSFEFVLLAMLLEQKKEITSLRGRLEKLV